MLISETDKLSLRSAIGHYVALNVTSVPKETSTWMATQLTNFVIEAAAKFERGQKEHGGDIKDRDLDAEMKAEIMDMFWYNAAKKK